MKFKVLAPVHPNEGVTAEFRGCLERLIEEMNNSVQYWLAADPEIVSVDPSTGIFAQDASPAAELQRTVAGLKRRWNKRFSEAADELGKYFAQQASKRSDARLKAILKKSGFAVEFKMTAAQQNIMTASVQQSVSLIKSIPAQYFTQVEGSVMRSVQRGFDIGGLADELKKHYGVTKRRAAFIARDQNAKATSSLNAARQQQLGIEYAIWAHSGGGHVPRPSHVKAGQDRVKYKVRKGWFDPAIEKFIWPGSEPNCFPGNTRVGLESGLVALWRTVFNGPMIYIKVGSDLIESTPNHPILTTRGWVRADKIDRGDYVVCMTHQRGDVVYDYKDDGVTTFEELFEARSRVFGYISRDGVGFDFHGQVPDGNVDQIIVVDNSLRTDLKTSITKDRREFEFAGADSVGGGAGARSHDALTNQNVAHISSRMSLTPKTSGDGDCAEAGLVERDDFLRARISVESGIHLDAERLELLAQLVGVASDSHGGILELRSRFYEFRRVEDQGVRDFSGHVFTMQTLTGHYSVGAACAQAKNCRCVARPIIPSFI